MTSKPCPPLHLLLRHHYLLLPLQQLRPLLVPYTIKATAAPPSSTEVDAVADEAGDEQQQQKKEAATMLLITQLLEQLVSLQDLDQVLILVRSHRVLHQVTTPLIKSPNPLAMRLLRPLPRSVLTHRQLMAVAIARGFQLPFSLMGMKVLCVALNSEANARDACDYKQGRFVSAVLSQLPVVSTASPSADVDDLSFCIAVLCEQLTQ